MFKKIKSIITIENTKVLKLESYSTDYEISLLTALKKIFKGIKQIGCYFHYCKNIRKNAIKLKIINNKDSKCNELIKEIYTLPFKYRGDYANMEEIYTKFSNKKNKEFLDYFKNQWERYFLNNMLNYSSVNKSIRSNSYIENYNRRIKLKLSKFLYGKNKCLITWPFFLFFIINEENEYKHEIYNSETNLEEKFNINYNNYMEETNISNQLEVKSVNENNILQFLRWKNNSCRYDIFFYIFSFIILNDIENKNNFENNNIDILKNISIELINANPKILEGGIWNLLNNHKTLFFDLTTEKEKYKQFNSFLQCINLLNNDSLFCIKYTTMEGCLICNTQIMKENYFQPFIELNKDDLKNQIDLNSKLNHILSNQSNTCLNCGYDKEGKIINENTYYKIITSKLNSLYLFISMEFMDLNSGEYENYLEQEIKNFDERIKFNKEIIDFIKADKLINNDVYVLVGIITTPSNDHYTGIIVNMPNDKTLLKKNKNYYYDSKANNNSICEIENLEQCLNDNNPYIALYKKKF